MNRYKVYFTMDYEGYTDQYYCFIVAQSARDAKALFQLDYVLNPDSSVFGKEVSHISARKER